MNNFFCSLFSCSKNTPTTFEQTNEISLGGNESKLHKKAAISSKWESRINIEDEEEYIDKLPIRRLDTEDGMDLFDLVIVGGGSAGVACAVEAHQLGLKVAIINYVKPSPEGSKWGWGGTCLNVGCIPKFMFHQAADQIRKLELSQDLGLEMKGRIDKLLNFNWKKLSKSVQNYIKSESYSISTLLRTNKIKNYNRLAKFVDQNTVGLYKKWDSKEMHTAVKGSFFLIATGERPVNQIEGYTGLEHCISTDDFFKVTNKPEKVLVLGGGYIALEVASILVGFGIQCNLYHRSNLVKDIGGILMETLENRLQKEGLKIRKDLHKLEISRTQIKKKLYKYLVKSVFKADKNIERVEEYDMVVNCFKREANLDFLKELEIDLNDNKKRIKGGYRHFIEQTSISNIFAAGDVLHGVVHNEPAAAISGKRVAQYVHSLVNKEYSELEKLRKFNFDFMPYCLFSTPEIAGVGITQMKANLSYPEGGFAILTLEKAGFMDGLHQAIKFDSEINKEHSQDKDMIQIIYLKKTLKIIGLHYLGEHAGDIIQGYVPSLKKGITLKELNLSNYISPSSGEKIQELARIGFGNQKNCC